MLLFRSISVGLLGAVLYFVATPAPPAVVVARASPSLSLAREAVTPALAVIDVAPGVEPSRIAGLVRLEPDERITHVADRAVASDLEAGAAIALRAARRREGFIDLAIASPASPARRVLVLLH